MKQQTHKSDMSLREIILYEPERIEALLQGGGSREYKNELKALRDEESTKPLASANYQVLKGLLGLKSKFPNFNEVIDYYRKALQLSLKSKSKIIDLNPMLFVGPPGVGKTRFLSELGQVLTTGFYSLDMSSVSAGFVLSGISSQWGNAKPGFVTTSLRDSEVANPLILLDEIDKAQGSEQHTAINCFYSLLQRHSARQFVDEFLSFPMDCSHINWVASANYIERIEPAILSRMTVIQVELPTAEQSVNIIKSIYQEIRHHHEWGNLFAEQISDEVVEKLKCLPPRMIEKALLHACYNAFDRDNKTKPCAIIPNDINLPARHKPRSIGFI